MRKVIACALLFAACGTWSNEDLEFVYALPDKATLHSVPPGETDSTMQGITRQGLSVGDDSPAAANTQTTSNNFNAFLDTILDGLDGIRQIPPTTRGEDSRTWGPYADDQHTGFEVEVEIDRLDAGLEYDWEIRYRQLGQAFFALGGGHFAPTETLKEGTGDFQINALTARQHFDAGDSGDPDVLGVNYVTDKSPKQVDMFFQKGIEDGGTNSLAYAYEQNDAGTVHATFNITSNDPNITTLGYDVKWDESGQGLAKVSILAGNWADAGVSFEECWDSSQKVLFSNMIFDGGPSPIGLPGACPMINGI